MFLEEAEARRARRVEQLYEQLGQVPQRSTASPPSQPRAAFPPDGLTPATPDQVREFFARRR